jgi:uncharacterized membrane protein YbaN (DUF454 family)
MKKLLKPLFVALGLLAFAIGTLGIFLPVLPTTPLYLLTLFCFARGSERFHRWFTGTKLYKRRLENFVSSRSMTLRSKLMLCIPVSALLIVTMIFAPIWHARVLIAAAMLFKWYYFMFRIKTIPGVKKSETAPETTAAAAISGAVSEAVTEPEMDACRRAND